jgi:hypothetical protein
VQGAELGHTATNAAANATAGNAAANAAAAAAADVNAYAYCILHPSVIIHAWVWVRDFHGIIHVLSSQTRARLFHATT